MNITQIDYPDCVINIEDQSGNYTKLKHDSLVGLTIFTQNGLGEDNTAEITSTNINFNTNYSDNTITNTEIGSITTITNTNANNETKQGIYNSEYINFNNNQDSNNLSMFYKGTGIETNNNFNVVTTESIILDASRIDISGQSSFNQPPHSVDPIYGNDLATKGYVDSLVGQYSGGFNLFFNYSVTDSSYSSYKSLGQEVVTSAQQIVDITTNGGPVLVEQFITLPLGINEIPAGLWNTWIYGAVNNTNGELQYFFTLLKFDGTTETLISTSSLSPDVNASPNNNPDSYHMNATISTPYILSLTDRLVIKLYVQKVGGTSVTIRTFFQNSYYSFTQSTLNAGTTLISSNNIWSGTNTFMLGVTTPSISSSASLTLGSSGKTTNIEGNLQIAGSAGSSGQVLTSNGTTTTWTNPTTSQWVNDATSDLSMNTYTIHCNTIKPNFNNNTLNIAVDTERSGTLNLQTSSTAANAINIGSTTTTTTLRGTLLSNNIDALTSNTTLNIGTTNASSTIIGRTNKITNIQGNLQVAGSAGSSGQVLTSDGTTATWATPSSGWSGTATSDLNMSNFSIQVDTINPITSSSNLNIALGTGRTGQVNIQTTATGANTINIGSNTTTTIIKGLKSASIDTATSESLSIGNTSATSITVGKTGIITTIDGTLQALTSTMNTLQTNATNTTTNLYTENVTGTANLYTNSERTGTLNIQTGSTSANTINIGSETTTTNLYGLKTPSIDTISSTTLNIGNTTATGILIGRSGQPTNISGNLQIGGSAGSSGQVLTSNGTTATWSTPTSGWSNTALSNLNMSKYSILNASLIDSSNSQLYIGNVSATGITIGKTGIITRINGNLSTSNVSLTNLYIDNTVNFNTASDRNVVLKNDSNIDEILSITKTLNTKNYSFNIEYQKLKINDATINSGNNNESNSLEIGPSQFVFTYQNPAGYYYTVFNNGGFYTSLGATVTTTINYFKLESLSAYSFINNVSFTMRAPNIYILGATQIDANNTQLSIGNTSATGILIGRSGQTTNLQGNLQVDGSAGSSGQVLTSNGTTATWTTPSSGWSGTATSTLNMANYSIINASSIDTNNLSLKLGNTSASGVIIGRAGQVTDISGDLQIAGSAGTNGQVLTSNGTSASWSSPQFIGTATSTLNMANYSITNASSIDTNNLSLKLGTTTASGILIGRSGQVTNLQGNLQVAGSAGSSGQVLTSNGTTASWSAPSSGWSGTATSDLNMSNFSIQVDTINPITTSSNLNIALGTGRSGQVNIQTTATGANTINIGSDNSTTIIKGLKTIDMDTSISEPLTIGTTNASVITIGKSSITTNFPGTVYITTALHTNTINTTGSASVANLFNNLTTSNSNMLTGATTATVNMLTNSERTGTTNIQTGSTSANTINIGSATTTTNFSGIVVSNNGINANTIRNINVNDTTSLFDDNISGVINIANNASRTATLNLMTNNFSASISNTLNLGGYGTKIYVGGYVSLNQITHSGGTTSNLFNNMTTQDVFMFCLSTRAGTLNINTSSTVSNTINIGSATTTTNFSGVINVSTIKNCSFIDNSGTIVIGNTSSTGITIGRSGQVTNLQGNLQVAGLPGTNGQVLTSNGTTASWSNAASGWNGTATTNLNMGNFSIIASSLDATDTNNPILYIGSNNASHIYIGNSNVNTYITGGRANTLISNTINTTGGTTGGILWNNVSTGTCNIATSSLRAGITNIQTGSTSANTINIGTATTTTNISGVVNVSTIKNCSFIDNSGTIVIGNTSSTGITIGRSGQVTNLQGNLQVAGLPGTNGQVLTSNGTTASWSNAVSGWNGTATSDLTMGIYKLKTNEIDLNSTGNIDYKLFFSAASTDEIYLGSYDIANTANIQIGKGNQPIFIGGHAGRTNTIEIGNYATGTNYISIGSATTINTISGATLNLNSTGGNVNIGTSGSGTITIGNATTTALNIGDPITPTYSYNVSTTGTNIVGTIGNILTTPASAITSVSTTAHTVISSLAITSIGVYMISVYLSFGTNTAGTNDRLRVYVGYGASNNTSNNVYAYTIPKRTLGNTIATGASFNDVLCFPYTFTSIASPNNFLTVTAQNTGTTTIPLSPAGTFIQAVRIA